MIIAIIPSAGKGKRLKSEKPKQFLEINGIPLIIHTLLKFENHPQVDGIIICTSSEYLKFTKNLVDSFSLKKILDIVKGGETRQDSVFCGVKSSPPDTEIFLVHDAVRPFVSSKLISEVIENTKKYGASVPALPVRDTLNKVKEEIIIQNIDRTDLFAIQTPQGIKAKILKTLLEKAKNSNLIFSDESSLLLYYGYEVRIVKGLFINFKITYPEDLFLAEKLIHCKIENLL